MSQLIESTYQRAKDILLEHKDLLSKLAQQLLEKEVIFREDLETIFGKRKWEKPEEAEIVEKKIAQQHKGETDAQEENSEQKPEEKPSESKEEA